VPFLTGCIGPIQEVVLSEPYGADIYWGKTRSSLKLTGLKTPHSRSISASKWEFWCYQVKKEGYRDSEIICSPEESNRLVEFYLRPVKTTITSDPPGAIIYWGPSADQLRETQYFTPHTETSVYKGANYKDWYFQVKKRGYYDSEVIFKPRSSSDRYIYFELKPFN
jgi:hypothetical protein